MNESVTVAKEADAKKASLSTHESDERIHRARNESERQLGSLGAVIDTIKSDGSTPSADSIATQLSSMHTTQHAPVLLALQQMHGNRYVQRVVLGIQAKLVVGQPGDKYEQEADRVADAVMQMPEPGVQRQVEEEEEEELVQPKLITDAENSIQRQVEEEEEEELLQTKELTGHKAEITPDLESRIQAIRGGGKPLSESERIYFEPRFGQDFSQVRLHTDAQAAESARAVNARAFTVGRDVVFGAGQYAPGTGEGRRLMAHELTHVVQQRADTRRVTQIRRNGESSDTSETYDVHFSTKTVSGRENQIESSVSPETIQLSPLSEEVEGIWVTGDKGAFFDRLRSIRVSDTDVHDFVEATLHGDDLWLARNILNHGPEASWPIHLRVEREMKGWGDCGGKGVVFDILRTANGSEARNADLTTSLTRVFAAGSDDLWRARNLQAYGPEASWPMNVFIPPGSATAVQVQFTANHSLTPYGSDRRSNAIWNPASTDHATAYTRGTSPALSARFRVGRNFSRINIPQIQVRVTEGGAVRGTASAAVAGDAVSATGVSVAGLTGSTEVRSSSYQLAWEVSLNGTTWAPITTTGPHPIYWLHATPSPSPLHTLAVAKATDYVAGAGNVAATIRTRLRDEIDYRPDDLINADPLTIFADRVAICTDFANLLTLLARSVGLSANTVLFWGGFRTLGRNVRVTMAGSSGTLVDVRSPNPAYNPPGLTGWPFTYHAISKIGGTLQDAALDRTGYDAHAVREGDIVHLVELAPGGLPGGTVGSPYNHTIPRRDHVVGVTVRDYGPYLSTAQIVNYDRVTIPPGMTSPIEVPVTWSISSGALPAGLSLDGTTGVIIGTPTVAGTFPITIRVVRGALTNTVPLNLTVTAPTPPTP